MQNSSTLLDPAVDAWRRGADTVAGEANPAGRQFDLTEANRGAAAMLDTRWPCNTTWFSVQQGA